MPEFGVVAVQRQSPFSFERSAPPASVHILPRCVRRHYGRGGCRRGALGKYRLPKIFVDLADAPGAGFAALPFVWLEGGGDWFPWCRVYILGGFCFGDPTVNFRCCGFPHFVRDMGVHI